MLSNYKFRDINDALPRLLRDLLKADEVGSRAGRTKEMMHVGITLTQPWRREILRPGRKANIAAQIAETMWVLSGRNDVEWLSHYLPRAADFSDDGATWRSGYGPRLRNWNGVDQLAYVVDTLKADPLSRQAVAVLWDPAVDPQPSKDRACNNWLSFSSRLGRLDLHVAIRSNDVMWGWSGINAFEWSAVQEIVAGLLGLEIGALHFSTTSFHLYDRHWAKAEKLATDTCPPLIYDSPRFNGNQAVTVENLTQITRRWFEIEYDIRTGSPLVQTYIDDFPEPMLQSWLRVLQWWWSGVDAYLRPLLGTNLWHACQVAVQPPEKSQPACGNFKPHKPHNGFATENPEPPWCQGVQSPAEELDQAIKRGYQTSPFLAYVTRLHEEKHAAYGDSWKRRGEMLGILANIARKIDRLGGAETSDETAADTAIDLMVYLAKMRVWLMEQGFGPYPAGWGKAPGQGRNGASDSPAAANALLERIDGEWSHFLNEQGIKHVEGLLKNQFEALALLVEERDSERYELVDEMLIMAYRLARTRWEAANRDDYAGADVD